MAISVIVLSVMCLALLNGVNTNREDEELEVVLEFVEFDLEDACIRRNEAVWAYRNGSQSDLSMLASAEIQHSQTIHHEIKQIQEREQGDNEHSSKKLTRLLDLFLHPGPLYLAPEELKEMLDFSIKLEEQNSRAVNLNDGRNLTRREVEKILLEEQQEPQLQQVWTQWFQGLENMPEADWQHHLTLLDVEAEVNGEDELSKYWLKQSDTTWVDYEKALELWQEIIPLYQKLRQFIANSIVSKYGKDAIIDQKLLPVHLMGSLDTTDWLTTADKLGALDQSQSYQYLKKQLQTRSHQDIYKMADNFTSQIQLGVLPPGFYTQSRFDTEGETCEHVVSEYCKPEYGVRVMTCMQDLVKLTDFIAAHDDVMRAKHLIEAGREELELGYLRREGPRESVLYDALSGVAAVLAMNSGNLRKHKLLPELPADQQTDDSITNLLLTALHVIPAMPYYLAADQWRIKALKELDTLTTTEMDTTVTDHTDLDIDNRRKRQAEEEDYEEDEDLPSSSTIKEQQTTDTKPTETQGTEVQVTGEETTPMVTTTPTPPTPKVYNEKNITMEWWEQRAVLQGMGKPGNEYRKDFILDKRIIWNRSYISKFLGTILQFQVLEYFRSTNSSNNTLLLHELLKRGKSSTWEEAVSSVLNITELSTKPLRDYFEPLEAFLVGGGSFHTKRTPIFNENDFKLFSQSSSLNSNRTVSQAAEGSDAVLYTLAAVAALGTVAMVLTIARRRHQRQKRIKRERRRRALEEI